MDTAQAYKNEAHVGQGLRNEGISRSDVFISMDCFFLSLSVNEMNLVTFLATKIISKFHGYPSTMQAVDESLERFQFRQLHLTNLDISFQPLMIAHLFF